MVRHEASARPTSKGDAREPHASKTRAPQLLALDSLTIRAISVEADSDVRSVQKELAKHGSVRGRPGKRIRAVLARRGLRPVRAA